MPATEELKRFHPPEDTLITVGVFDGVHLGHQHLLRQVKEKAQQCHLLAGAIILHPHPRTVLSPKSKVPYLTSLDERLKIMRALGLELLVPLTFSRELSQLTARQFVLLLKHHLRMRGLVIGPDFTLGRGREGNAPTLAALGQELSFTVDVVPPLQLNNQVVSSTAVRGALQQGQMEAVGNLLGRNYSLTGPVVRGVERGRLLGFPTANLAPDPNRALPPDGVYATRAYLSQNPQMSVTNIGIRPTFGEGQRTVEVYLLDFEADIYGKTIRIELVQRLRGERQFESPEELRNQIQQDIVRARAVLEV